jgi:hypothetical protein
MAKPLNADVKDLATLLGISYQYAYKIYRGEKPVTAEHMAKTKGETGGYIAYLTSKYPIELVIADKFPASIIVDELTQAIGSDIDLIELAKILNKLH